NRCYIGFTVDPNRRIRQHNGGKQAGGAAKTDNRGPWDMVCIIHGFPNLTSGLRFEWAWQNSDKSRRLKLLKLRKAPKETQFAFRLRIVAHMLRSEPWKRLALTFRWLIPEKQLPFPAGLEMPEQMETTSGLVEKTKTLVTEIFKAEDRTCSICKQYVQKVTVEIFIRLTT
uniref:GIY-YIG domain-containing protein n=1 Tax=Plectus sambesii TaxID=2011161 RepID=A0A914UWS3_9BILA